jgi:uncharacterized RDD family membrane protein YckC
MFGGKIGVPELLILFMLLCFFPVVIAAWWRIFSKAGHPGPLGLAMLIPGVNLAVFLWFAFSTWPIEKPAKQNPPMQSRAGM